MKTPSFGSLIAALLLIFSPLISLAASVEWFNGKDPVTVSLPGKNHDAVVQTAFGMFAADMKDVTGLPAKLSSKGTIVVNQLDKASASVITKLSKAGVPVSELRGLTDGFNITVHKGKIYVTGTNGRGAAYGLLELSRLAGVSPWVWWGDIVPQRKSTLSLPADFSDTQGASVEYRGIFLNDEDWSLRPWSYGNFEPADFGRIGPKTYRKIFELLLRLRANTIWPGMHTGTEAFFKNPLNKAMADSCGIAIGTSHCEPLLRNNVDEWSVADRGPYNYRTNKQAVQDYWIERLKEVKGSEGGNIFTIGMRGIHDSSMEGYRTEQEKFDGLQEVIDDQQQLLSKYIGDPSKQPQVFVPYKEVLQLYEKGLKVPDYVTLMWCDDNYGYMTRLSNPEEQKRKGGGGVYYHLSYWGRPHDYLWLTTTQPGLIYNEMREAYDHNVRKMWIANVHDPKVAGYDLELFLDMAWDINSVDASSVGEHYKAWLCREFGPEVGSKLYPVMHEFFRLAGQRRPEFMGWNQVELDKRLYNRGLSPVSNTDFSTQEFGNELDRYLERYAAIAKSVTEIGADVAPEHQDAYFAAILYPVLSTDAHARKILESQKARSVANGSTLGDMFANQARLYSSVAKSQDAYQQIRSLTEKYNSLGGGKWNRIMNMRPRDLPVFAAPNNPTLLTDAQVAEWLAKSSNSASHPLKLDGAIALNASQFSSASEGATPVSMLGHSMSAVRLPKGGSLTYDVTTDSIPAGVVRVALIPTQPNDSGDIRFSVSIDGAAPQVFSLKEPFRSERWKQNVLRGQAVRDVPVSLAPGSHTIKIEALDNHILVDQLMIDPNASRKFYLFPTE